MLIQLVGVQDDREPRRDLRSLPSASRILTMAGVGGVLSPAFGPADSATRLARLPLPRPGPAARARVGGALGRQRPGASSSREAGAEDESRRPDEGMPRDKQRVANSLVGAEVTGVRHARRSAFGFVFSLASGASASGSSSEMCRMKCTLSLSRTSSGTSLQSARFCSGRMICLMPNRAAASTFSLMPPTRITRPRRLISPGHGHVRPHPPPGQQRRQRRHQSHPGAGPVLGRRARGHVNVQVVFAVIAQVDAQRFGLAAQDSSPPSARFPSSRRPANRSAASRLCPASASPR